MIWARLADTWGRKPVIMLGLVMSMLANLAFGFSRSIHAAMFWRIVAGAANGNVGVMRTMTAEIVTEKRFQGRAFLLLPLVFNSGMIIGLAVGGFLADPVTYLPGLLGAQGILNINHNPDGIAWLRTYPYALPTVFNASTLGLSLLLGLGGLKETLLEKTGKKDYGLMIGEWLYTIIGRSLRLFSSGYQALPSEDIQELTEKHLSNELDTFMAPPITRTRAPTMQTTRETIWTSDVLCMLVSFAVLPLHNSSFMQLFPLFLSTPRSTEASHSLVFFRGGLGLPASTVALWLSSFGVLGLALQLLVFPALQARLGALGAYRLALAFFPAAYLLAPYLVLLPAAAQPAAIAAILFLQVTARTFAIPGSVILLTDSVPDRRGLGSVHGAGGMLSSLARGVGPVVSGCIFVWGVERGAVGAAWWLFLCLTAVVGFLWSFRLRESESLPIEADKQDVGKNT